MAEKENYRKLVFKALPNLGIVDGVDKEGNIVDLDNDDFDEDEEEEYSSDEENEDEENEDDEDEEDEEDENDD